MIGTIFTTTESKKTYVVIDKHHMFEDTWKCYPAEKEPPYKPNLIDCFSTEFINKCNYMEISDKEIEKAVNEYASAYQCPSEVSMCKHDVISAWNNAIKWYREQIKRKNEKP